MQLRCWGDFEDILKSNAMALRSLSFAASTSTLDSGSLPILTPGWTPVCQGFWQVPVGLLMLKTLGSEVPLKLQKWLGNLLANTSEWPQFTFSSGKGSHLHCYQDLVPHLCANLVNQIQQQGEIGAHKCLEKGLFSSRHAIGALSYELSVLKHSQGIGKKCGQRHTIVQAWAKQKNSKKLYWSTWGDQNDS